MSVFALLYDLANQWIDGDYESFLPSSGIWGNVVKMSTTSLHTLLPSMAPSSKSRVRLTQTWHDRFPLELLFRDGVIPDRVDRLAFGHFGHLNHSDFGKDHQREVQMSQGSVQGRMSTGALARDDSTYLSILIASAKAKAGCTGAHGMRLAASFSLRRRSVPVQI